jgi:hypothetical protein
VKEWEDKHPGEECWFASFVGGVVSSQTYGIKCHILPNAMAVDIGQAGTDLVPPVIHGTVLLSASDVAGGIWPSRELNPYRRFQTLKPDEEIDYGILVYKGDVPMGDAAGISRALQAWDKLDKKLTQDGLALAEQGVTMAPDNLFAQWALGDAEAATGKKDAARAAYEKAIGISARMEPERAAEYAGYLQASLKRL